MAEYGWIIVGDGRKVYRRLDRRCEPQRSHLSTPYIRADGMDATINPIDGKPYDSKSQYYATVKAHGCEIVGNDSHWDAPAKTYEPEGVREDLIESWKRLS